MWNCFLDYVVAGEDDLEDVDADDVEIDDHGATEETVEQMSDDGDEGVGGLGKSEDAETTILFIKPTPNLAGSGGPGRSIQFLW